MTDQTSDFADDEVSLRPYFEAVWRHRQIVGATIGAAAIAFAIIALALYVMLPKERLASLGVRFTFEGAENNKYPNGTVFTANEVTSTPVLSDVYAGNDLQRYGSFRDFQQSLFVLQTSAALQQLDYDYQSKLSDTRLTSVDRDKLENEFMQKRDALRVPEYILTLHRRERFAEMPPTLVEKVLRDAVETWARQADVAKGAARPDVDIVSRDAFARAAANNDNFLIRIDILRTGAERLLDAMGELQRVSGARAVKTADNRTLSDELINVQNILKFDVEPMVGMARLANASPQDRAILSAYVTNQLARYRLDYEAATARAQSFQTSLREYMAQRGGRVEVAAQPAPSQALPGGPTGGAVPQLGDALIDRLMEMTAATQNSELLYRRDLTNKFIAASNDAATAAHEIGYYDALMKQLSAPPALGGAVGSDVLSQRFNTALDALNVAVDRIQKLYDAIAVQTLNPSRRLYQIAQPFRMQTVSAVAWPRVMFAFLLTLGIAFVAGIVGSLVREQRRRVDPTAKSASPGSRRAVSRVESGAGV